MQKAIKLGNREGAQIYAQNAIREKNQGMSYLKLSSRLDGVASRLETAIRTKAISKSMEGVVKGMGKALESMDPVKVCIYACLAYNLRLINRCEPNTNKTC